MMETRPRPRAVEGASRQPTALALLSVGVAACGADGAASRAAVIDVAPPPAIAASAATSPAPTGCSVLGLAKRWSTDDTSEAKNILGAISRSAVSAYEREAVDGANPSAASKHTLCESATPFPRTVPRCGESSTPSRALFGGPPEAPGGWSCLRFETTGEVRWQFGYISGGPYKGLERGAADPGRAGFQAYAERDVDGDGATALLVISGRIDPNEGFVRLTPEVVEIDPRE